MFGYSIRKCRAILRSTYKQFQRKKGRLSQEACQGIEVQLRSLDASILEKDKKKAAAEAKKTQVLAKEYLPKTFFDHMRELAFAIAFAIVIAFSIRQVWFELYEVPTGSMRPTVEEQDRLVVSKTTFGVSLPFIKKPLFYSDSLLERGGIVVFTVQDMDVDDANMLYFHLIPGKKRFIKRNVAKPGDTLYFYGGKIYGIDQEGNPIDELSNDQYLEKHKIAHIDHIPYITMDGKSALSRKNRQNFYSQVTLKQMNQPIGKLSVGAGGNISGTFYDGDTWIKDDPARLKAPHETPKSYSDLWGIKNYAMARLLTQQEAKKFHSTLPERASYYLELKHTPNLTYPKPLIRQDEMGKYHPMITPYSTLIPLDEENLKTLFSKMDTARFVVRDEKAFRYQEKKRRPQPAFFDISLPGVPNGCYEFVNGKGYKVLTGGILTPLRANHPLMQYSPALTQTLFNAGVGFNLLYEPKAEEQPYNPQRFAYFREGDLFVMRTLFLKKEDPLLQNFVALEREKQESSSQSAPYIAFIDAGPPIKEGKLDVEFIKAFGLKVPEDNILALGDNFSMSADSRDFGFVPTENLRGAPAFTFWPPGKRVGPLPGPHYSWWTFPNILIWTVALLALFAWFLWTRKKNQTSIFKD